MKRFSFIVCSTAALLSASSFTPLRACDFESDFPSVGQKDSQRRRSLTALPPSKRALSYVIGSSSSEEEPASSPDNKRQGRYGIATYDALFKYVLSHTDITPSFEGPEDSKPLRDWVTYLKRAHLMTQKEVEETIEDPEVLKPLSCQSWKKFLQRFVEPMKNKIQSLKDMRRIQQNLFKKDVKKSGKNGFKKSV